VMKLLAAHGLHYPKDYTLLAVGPILSRWKMLQSGEIDGGLQGAPLNYIAVDAGFSDLGNPRSQFPDFQFTSLDVDSDWARQNRDTVVAFLMAYRQAHRWFYANKAGATEIAVRETGVEKHYAERAWDEYVRDEIFPRDARASAPAVQALIEVSSLIRDLPTRSKSRAEQYINPSYFPPLLT
jgi:NitT/TauT family transport system substrate-binding protein